MLIRSDESDQLTALGEITRLLDGNQIAYWLFGGWAVDFHAGRVTRPHEDLDLAIWAADHARVMSLLVAQRWEHRPEPDEDGYTCYVRGPVRLETAFLAADAEGRVFTPLAAGRAEWPASTFGDDVMELHGVRARTIRRDALIADKSIVRSDSVVAAKDRADLASLGDRGPDGGGGGGATAGPSHSI